MEILLQTIVEKLESLEIAFLKQGDTGKDEELEAVVRSIQSELIKFNLALNANNEKIDGLSEDMCAFKVSSGNPLQNQVQHIHHFHKQVWISVSLFIISLLLAYGWINCSIEKKSYEANDMKYRYWKTNGNTNLLKIIYYTDSIYNLDKENFVNRILRAEHQIVEQDKMRRLADEKEKQPKKILSKQPK